MIDRPEDPIGPEPVVPELRATVPVVPAATVPSARITITVAGVHAENVIVMIENTSTLVMMEPAREWHARPGRPATAATAEKAIDPGEETL